MKGIILAGGTGSRLAPLTRHTSKQLLPVFDKPLIYYPLTTLMLAGVREICVVTTPRDSDATRDLLGDGTQWGVSISYASQERPRGIAEAFSLAEPMLGNSRVSLVLGDNIFHGAGLGSSLMELARSEECVIFGYEVANPSAYGVVEIDEFGRTVGIQEKPDTPRSRLAVPGLYFYPKDVYQIAREIRPSPRGELEITDVNQVYLTQGRLKVIELPRGTVWMDCGTVEDLYEAATYIQVVTRRQGVRVGCPEEVAWRNGWISDLQLTRLAQPLRASGYGTYLLGLFQE